MQKLIFISLIGAALSAQQIDYSTQVKNKIHTSTLPGTGSNGTAGTGYLFRSGTGNGASWIGAIYPDVQPVRVGWLFSSTAETTDTNTQHFGLAGFAEAKNAVSNTVGMYGIAKASVNNAAVWGGNILATSAQAGLSGTKLVGLEIDLEPAAGSTPTSDSGGLFVNVFNEAVPAPAIQTGGISGGTFNNGIVLYNIADSGTGLAAGGGETMASLVNCAAGTMSEACVVAGNTQPVKFSGTAGAHAYIYNDASNYLRIIPGSAGKTVFRNNSDTDDGETTARTYYANNGSVSTFVASTASNGIVGTATAHGLLLETNGTARINVKSSGIVNIASVPTYADNAAAVAGGLVNGDVYRTSTGQLMIVY